MVKVGLFLKMLINISANSNMAIFMEEVITITTMAIFIKVNGFSQSDMAMGLFYGRMEIVILVNTKTISATEKEPMYLPMGKRKKVFGRMVRWFERFFLIK